MSLANLLENGPLRTLNPAGWRSAAAVAAAVARQKHPGFSGQSCLHYLTQDHGMVTNDRDGGGYQLAEQPHPFKR